MRGHYEQAKLIIPQPFKDADINAQNSAAQFPASHEPSLRSLHYGAGAPEVYFKRHPNSQGRRVSPVVKASGVGDIEISRAGFAKLSEYFLPAPRSFSDAQNELPANSPPPSVGDAAIFHLVGPIFVEVEYSVEPEAEGPFNIYAEVSPLVVRLLYKDSRENSRILQVWGWEAAPDALRSIVVHPSAAELGWSDEAILEAVKERFQAGQRE